jgi:hypothetical protein
MDIGSQFNGSEDLVVVSGPSHAAHGEGLFSIFIDHCCPGRMRIDMTNKKISTLYCTANCYSMSLS